MAHRKAAATTTAFKHKINLNTVKKYAAFFTTSPLKFEEKKFTSIIAQLEPLELKDRVRLIAQYLDECLQGNSYKQILKASQSLFKKEDITGFELWPLSYYVQTCGLDSLEASLDFQKKVTCHFTSEFSIRPYLKQYPKETYEYLLASSQDANHHIRRWSSEGTRPRLPWGDGLKISAETKKWSSLILGNLFMDESEYVRKSVANHLNDYSKSSPDFILNTLKNWKKKVQTENDKKHFHKLELQALRTLIKQGHPETLKYLGYNLGSNFEIKDFRVSKKVAIGDYLNFQFSLKSEKPQAAIVDYAILFLNAKGDVSRKVFKITRASSIELEAPLSVKKKHAFKLITTRTYYPGVHQLEILVNGQVLTKKKFQLVE